VRARDPHIDETQFNDVLTANLRRGRFLLLIVGDGIREGVEAIAEYLQVHVGLHFSLGLVELPIYNMPNGDRLVVPRVLARTTIITRNVVALPDGYIVEQAEDAASAVEIDPDRKMIGDAQQRFWAEFIESLKLDDPEQPRPRPARLGYISLSLPARTSWLTVYRIAQTGEVGVFLSSWRHTPGGEAMEKIVTDFAESRIDKDEIGRTARLGKTSDGRNTIIDSLIVGSLDRPEVRKRAFSWLGARVNTFVNVLRPLMRSAAADYRSPGK
jgi:hypothetical protein